MSAIPKMRENSLFRSRVSDPDMPRAPFALPSSQTVVPIASGLVRFEPTAGEWDIDFGLLGTAPHDNLRIQSVTVDGFDVSDAIDGTATIVRVAEVRRTSLPEIRKYSALYSKALEWQLTGSESREYARIRAKVMEGTDSGTEPCRVRLNTAKLPFDLAERGVHPTIVQISNGKETFSIAIWVKRAPLPEDPEWSPADLHLHSKWSDGTFTPVELREKLQGMGYRILYFTDHVDRVQRQGGWTNYSIGVASASNSEVACYAGAEETVRHGDKDGGDLLAYGIRDLLNITNKTWPSQMAINNVHANNPGMSSPSIAHPTAIIDWTDWSVSGYKGLELMSGIQINCDHDAAPVARWCAEQSRCISNSAYPPSARAGSDFHGNVASPHHAGYVTWVHTGQWNSKPAVDAALYRAATVASRHGGLGYFTLTHSGVVGNVGETLTVPANAEMTLDITFKPFMEGTYSIGVYRDDKADAEFSITSAAYTAGKSYSPSGSNTMLVFPGGAHCYYLRIEGPDFIYSSPIRVKG